MAEPFLLAQGSAPILFQPRMGNRHGLIAGATGTGKTVTLQTLAESFSAIGVPVFMADIKGDLSGIAKPGSATPKIAERLKLLSLQVDIPIVMAVQLNRESMTTHPTAKPAQHQVAGSHQLLNTADAMYLVWRPARHITWEVGPWANIAVLLTPKRRDGEECGDLYFATRRNVCHFEPVPEAVRKELAGPEAQAILNGRNKGGY